MSNQTNFGATLDPAVSVHAQLAVKDEYTFAFLDLEDAHSERELERALTGCVEALQFIAISKFREPLREGDTPGEAVPSDPVKAE